MILIGIDPGVNTGLAILHKRAVRTDTGADYQREFECLISTSIIHALELVAAGVKQAKNNGIPVMVYIEDARKRTWFGASGREKLQGVGSVKRDSAIWEEFCVHHGIKFALIAPKDNMTKLSHDEFKKITGYTGRTNEHARDAGMLVWGR